MILVLALVLSIVLHEVAHALAALDVGDQTALRAGRLTLNPFAHVDPILTVMMPLAMYALAGVAVGAAKPLPIAYGPMSRRCQLYVASAGIVMNAVLAIVGWSLDWTTLLQVNLALVGFNLLPVPPLDGWRIWKSL